MKRVLYLHSTDFKCPSDFILLDDFKYSNKDIEKIARNLLKKTLDKKTIQSLDCQIDDDNFENLMLCQIEYGQPFKKIQIEVKPLGNARQIMFIQTLKLKNEIYVMCDVPFGMNRYEWDIHHQDYYPHRSRSSLQYVRPDNCTETAFFSSDLPKNIDIEKLQILGLQSELKKQTHISEKLYKADVLGVLDDEEESFEKYLNLNDVEENRDVMWLKLVN